MAGEIFNPNPIVFSSSKPTGRKSDIAAQSLWIDEIPELDDGVDDVDLIDQDEIFGTFANETAYQ